MTSDEVAELMDEAARVAANEALSEGDELGAWDRMKVARNRAFEQPDVVASELYGWGE